MSGETPEKKVVQHFSPPDAASPATGRSHPEDELPPPTFLQALLGYGSIILGLVLLALLVGFLMKALR